MGAKRGPDGQITDDEATTGVGGQKGVKSYDEATIRLGGAKKAAASHTPADDGDRTWRPGLKRAAEVADIDDDEDRPLPVGWLVVIEGPGLGSVLTLVTGHNKIGRGGSAHLVLDFGDGGISAEQCNILYEAGIRQFHIERMPGAAETYVDGTPLRALQELKANARVKMGQTTLRLTPFCDDAFAWPQPSEPT